MIQIKQKTGNFISEISGEIVLCILGWEEKGNKGKSIPFFFSKCEQLPIIGH